MDQSIDRKFGLFICFFRVPYILFDMNTDLLYVPIASAFRTFFKLEIISTKISDERLLNGKRNRDRFFGTTKTQPG